MKRSGIAMAAIMMAWGMGCVTAASGEPYFVDLSGVVNRTIQDDGIAGNNAGGWSDEGVNDLFIYPPIPSGDVERNGHSFRLLDSADATKPTVVMLRGEKLADLPAQVKVSVPDRKGKYVYFLQNAVRVPGGLGAETEVAAYTVQYADGTSQRISLHLGKELRNWWTAQWWDNSGADSWPIFTGQNTYTMKWKQCISVYAMRWTNPQPNKAIRAITLESAGKLSPAIFAITIDDADYAASPKLKQDYKRLESPPTGYFDAKLAGERKRIFQEMLKQEMVKGVRGIELVRPDLLALTLDAWVAGGPGSNEERAAGLQSPDSFTIRIDSNEPAHPAQVGRQSYEYWNGNIGPFQQNMVYWHTYYLKLKQPLKDGQVCQITVAGVDQPFDASASLTFKPADTLTRAIKVNQVAYSQSAKRRYAYLGWWAGDLGTVDFDSFPAFQVIDESNGKPVHQGKLTVRSESDTLSGEKVYEMDLSALQRGQYHILVDGLGRSSSFAVGGNGIDELYRQTNRAYYHQRAGAALAEPFTQFSTPIHHARVTRSGRVIDAQDQPGPNDPARTFKGGYYDAADFDVFTYHLRATAQTLAAYEMYPQAFGDRDLNIPESGNKVPDILDEAHWALSIYRELQEDSGAVPLGLGNGEDAQRDYTRQHGSPPPFGIFPPTTTSTAEYAAVAAQYARLIKKYDAKLSADYLASARKAFAWTQANPQAGDQAARAGKLMRTWAAAELYCTSASPSDHQAFKSLYQDGGYKGYHWSYDQYLPIFIWPYILASRSDTDTSIRDALRLLLISKADGAMRSTDQPAYRMGAGSRAQGMGWGSGNGGGRYADVLLRAFFLTGDQKYLDAASLNADFQLGCNPLSKTFISGMGDRPPLHPQIAAYLYRKPGKTGSTVQGITVYGLSDRMPDGYPQSLPAWRRWRDLGNGGAEISSEFTITETIGASSMLYSILHALQK